MNDDPEIFADNAEDGAMKALEEMEKRLKEVSDDRDRLLEALEPFASPPLYVFDRPLKYVPAQMTEDWIGGGWFSTEDFRRARAAIEGVRSRPANAPHSRSLKG